MLNCIDAVKRRCSCGNRKQERAFYCSQCNPIRKAAFRCPAGRKLKQAAEEIVKSNMRNFMSEAAQGLPHLPAELWLKILEYANMTCVLLKELTDCDEATIATAARLALDDRMRLGRKRKCFEIGIQVFSSTSWSRLLTLHTVKKFESLHNVNFVEPAAAPNSYRVFIDREPNCECFLIMRILEHLGGDRCVAAATWHENEASARSELVHFETRGPGGITGVVLDCSAGPTIAEVRFASDVRTPPDMTGAVLLKEGTHPFQWPYSGHARVFLRWVDPLTPSVAEASQETGSRRVPCSRAKSDRTAA